MFENLELDHAARESQTVEVSPEIVKLVEQAWDWQEANERDQVHIVALASKEEVDVFHKFARAAAKQREVPLKYRRLSRANADKSDKKAYFSLALPEVEAEIEDETEPETVVAPAPKPAVRRRGASK
jgi:hypothetical protein